MQISKSTHLKHLLRTQDVLLSGLAYAVSTQVLWFVGYADVNDVIRHLTLLPFVLLFSIFAGRFEMATIHGMRKIRVAVLCARYAAIVVAGLLAVAYFSKLEFVSRYVLLTYGALLTSGLVMNRLFLRWWYFTGRREHPENYLQVLVVGTGPRAYRLMKTYKDNSEWGLNIIGMLDPLTPDHDAPPLKNGEAALASDAPAHLGSLANIRTILTEQVVDEVIVCLPRSLLDNVGEVVEACAEEAVCIKFLADLYEIEGGEYHLETVGTWPVLSLNPVTRNESTLIIKRIMDLMLTVPALIVLAPVFIITAIAIKLNSPGPVFFSQSRVGLNKRQFKMIKFRSMYIDAEARLAEIEHLNEAEGPIFKMKNDPRVTGVGGFIRRSSIDELPQLFNVLFGHMSLVGPRPMSVRDVSLFSKGVQRKRFSVRPGLACLREVSGRSALSFEQWLELDLKYIAEWSILLDLKILAKLVPAVIKGDGAS